MASTLSRPFASGTRISLNGWREDPATGLKDPHYEVIFRMFNTGTVYIPFEDSKDALPEDSDVVIAEDIEADELPDGSHE